MPIININIELDAPSAKITRTIKGLEMLYGRVNGESDLTFVKRIFITLLKEAHNRKRDAEVITAALIATQEEINPT